LKCLFLRVRDPSQAILDQFIKLVCGYDPYTEEAKSAMKATHKSLGDYRSKFNIAIAKLVLDFKKLKQKEKQHIPAIPSQNDVDRFIDGSVVTKKVLKRHIEKTNEAELKRNGSFTRIVQFVRECFKTHYKEKDVEKVKELDVLTKDLIIPSRSGHNLASSIKIEIA
jgi:hypothetical protein